MLCCVQLLKIFAWTLLDTVGMDDDDWVSYSKWADGDEEETSSATLHNADMADDNEEDFIDVSSVQHTYLYIALTKISLCRNNICK